MRLPRHYLLRPEIGEGRVPIPCTLDEWALWFRGPDCHRVVARTTVGDRYVSTVFLGLDHYFGNDPEHPPVLFETMVFIGGSSLEDECHRYSTWEDAYWSHREVVARIVEATGCQPIEYEGGDEAPRRSTLRTRRQS